MFDLTGKVVVVSGGNAGIGLGFARGIARAGGDIVIWGRRPEKNAEAAVSLAEFGGRVLGQEVDVSDEARVVEAMVEAADEMGRVDGVIANAGLMTNERSFLDMTTDAWHGLLAVNQHGAFLTMREGARQMKRQYDAGDRGGGSLLFCASLSALTGSPGMQHYNASKGAMVAMSRGIAVEAARYGIRCNVVCPGHTVSETVVLPDDHPIAVHVRAYNPSGRMGTTEDFEGIAVYFMSDWSRFHTGDLIVIDGGWMANAGKSDITELPGMAVKVLHVEGMREDTRTPQERETLEAAEAQPLDMSVERVLDAARADTGLDDFGPDKFGGGDFTERLGLLLGEVEADDNVWKAHKATFVNQCVSAAANRLLIQRYWDANPDALELEIERPVIVIALPRSGSTHLENLVGADRRLRHLPVYLAAQPAPRPDEWPVPDGIDPRWTRADARWQMMSQNEILAALHEHSPDHVCGENELQIPDFASYQWEWMAQVPGFRDHYLSHNQTPHYLYGRDVLKVIASQFPGEARWMMKSNQHSEQLGPLLTAYPDATVVMIHRDPVATLQSLLTMRGLMVKMSQKQPDIDGHVEYWVGRIERMLRTYVRDVHLVPPDQRVDVMFDEIIRDDVDAASGVLEQAGLPVTDECRADLETYMASHPRGKHGRVVYDLEGDFGLDADELRRRFAFYTDAFQIRPETKPKVMPENKKDGAS